MAPRHRRSFVNWPALSGHSMGACSGLHMNKAFLFRDALIGSTLAGLFFVHFYSSAIYLFI